MCSAISLCVFLSSISLTWCERLNPLWRSRSTPPCKAYTSRLVWLPCLSCKLGVFDNHSPMRCAFSVCVCVYVCELLLPSFHPAAPHSSKGWTYSNSSWAMWLNKQDVRWLLNTGAISPGQIKLDKGNRYVVESCFLLHFLITDCGTYLKVHTHLPLPVLLRNQEYLY